MKSARIEPNFTSWRSRAREFLSLDIPPSEILWEDGSTGAGSLFSEFGAPDNPVPNGAKTVRIPRGFIDLAQLVACHRDPQRWGVLYRVAWRLTRGAERYLLQIRTDDDVRRLEEWAAAVRRERHKMKAFVRFRKAGQTAAGREQFVAWFEPENHIVELTAPFFARRFAGMDWSILTPFQCAHWDGEQLRYTDGVTSQEAPGEDHLEEYWRSYYAHIFNPARLKLQAMRSEMPKKYWKNLPEAPLIAELTSEASTRAMRMVDAPISDRSHVSERIPRGIPQRPARPPAVDPPEILHSARALQLKEIATAASHCQACPLHERATQVVFGCGPAEAEIMIVGEQPGDQEDLSGTPFCGPSGKLLDEALEEVGIERESIYVTNLVKHFKWKRQGKMRLHQTPSQDEAHSCRPWVLAEIMKVRPHTLVLLGATVTRALVCTDFSITRDRGVVPGSTLAPRVIATFHPSFFLRTSSPAEFADWISDLRLARHATG